MYKYIRKKPQPSDKSANQDTEQEDKKYTPYFSNKWDDSIHLNEKVKTQSGDEIVCRHLALHWEEVFASTETHKVDYSLFDNEDAIRRHISTEKYDEMTAAPSIVQLVANSEWGNVIADTLNDMKQCGDCFRTLGVRTINHVMAFGLKIKSSGNGEDKWVIQFYDPNYTATHLRAEFPGDMPDRMSTIRKLEAEDFLSERALKFVGLINNGVSVFSERNNAVSVTSCSRLPGNVMHPMVMHHAMYLGLTDVLQSIAEQMNQDDLPSDKKVELLAGKNQYGMTGLAVALAFGHKDTLRFYVKLLKESGLEQKVISELLAMPSKSGDSGLNLLLQHGLVDQIRTYGEMLNESGLEQEVIVDLLVATGVNGPGLYMAIKEEQTDAILAYGEILNNSGLTQETKAMLLAAKKGRFGPSGLNMALNEGLAKSILAYGEILNGFGLTQEAKVELLAAKDIRNMSGLYFAIISGHGDAIRAYRKILNEPGLTQEVIAELDNKDLVVGLRIALATGHADAIRAYGEILNDSGLTQEVLLNKDLLIGLRAALGCGHADAIRAYGEILNGSGLAPSAIAELLPAMSAPAYKRHADAVRAYEDILRKFGLPT